MKIFFSLLIITSFINLSFCPADSAFCKRQGIKGHVYLVSGNQMPSPDKPPAKPAGIKTVLYVYELTNISQVKQSGSFYSTISSKLVREITTDEDGSFKAKLKPGMYSLFVKKGDLFYSNIFDGNNNIHPIEVKKGEWTEEEFKADYGATY